MQTVKLNYANQFIQQISLIHVLFNKWAICNLLILEPSTLCRKWANQKREFSANDRRLGVGGNSTETPETTGSVSGLLKLSQF